MWTASEEEPVAPEPITIKKGRWIGFDLEPFMQVRMKSI